MASRRVTIEFLGDDKSASKTARSVDTTTSKLGDTFKKVGKAAAIGLGVGIAAAGTALVAFGKSAVDEAREAQKVGAQTDAVLKSTGGVANITAKQVGDLANAISLKSGIDDEAIQSGENLLLTFTNIRNEVGKGNDIFDQATQIATDMSVALGTDMKSSATLVGKALNDPIKGVTALTRVGVAFTDQQKKQIEKMVESGDQLGAQKLILGELNKEFAGSAAAQATAGDKAKVAWETFQEAIGTKLLPILDKLLVWFVAKVIPALERFAAWFQREGIPAIKNFAEKVRAFVAPLIEWIVKHWPQISATVKKVLDDVTDIVTGVVNTVVKIWRKWGDDFWRITRVYLRYIVDTLKNVFKVIQGVVDVFAGLLKGDWSRVWKGLREIFGGVWDQIKNTLKTALKLIRELIRSAWDAVKDLSKRAWDGIKTLLRDAWESIKTAAGNAVGALRDKISNAFEGIKNWLRDHWKAVIVALVTGGLSAVVTWIAQRFDLAERIRDVFSKVKDIARDAISVVVDRVRSLPERLANLPDRMLHLGGHLIGGLLRGIVGAMRGIGSWIKDKIVDPIIDAVKGFFGISSPSKVFEGLGGHLMSGFAKGMLKGVGPLDVAKKVFGSLPDALAAIVKKGIVAIADLPKKAYNAIKDQLGDIAGGFIPGAPSYTGGASTRAAILRALAATHPDWASGDQWAALAQLISHESGFNPTAQNPTSTAYGLFQFLDSTWAGTGIAKTSDPYAQTIAGLRYISSRYGSPVGAWNFWQAHNWYGAGLQGGIFTKPTLIGVGERGPERVDVTPMGRRMTAGDVLVAEVNVYLDSRQIQNGLVKLKRRNGGLALGLS